MAIQILYLKGKLVIPIREMDLRGLSFEELSHYIIDPEVRVCNTNTITIIQKYLIEKILSRLQFEHGAIIRKKKPQGAILMPREIMIENKKNCVILEVNTYEY